jgi:hypothetical protein
MCHTHSDNGFRGLAINALARKLYLASGFHCLTNGSERRGFARTVRAKNGCDPALLKLETDTKECLRRAVPRLQSSNLK